MPLNHFISVNIGKAAKTVTEGKLAVVFSRKEFYVVLHPAEIL